MDFVLTIVASDTPLTDKHLSGVTQCIEDYKIQITSTPQWLEPNKAVDLSLSHAPEIGHIRSLQNTLKDDRIDLFISTEKNRRKKLLLADMDSTIVEGETLDDLAAYAGLKDKIAAITTRAMNGELDFKSALRERVSLLKDLPENTLHETLATQIINPGAKTFIGTMAAHGATCVLVSGGFTFFTSAIAEKTGFHSHHGNILDIKDGKLTGTVGEPICDKDTKYELLQKYSGELDLEASQTMAIGDGANDLVMLSHAGLGIGYRPKPLLKNALHNHILYGDLTAALFAQGYKSDEFVA